VEISGSNFVVDVDIVKNIRIAEQLMMMPLGDPWLGGFIDGDIITSRFELYSGNELVSGFTTKDFDIWIHNHDDLSNWWENPVENENHTHLDYGEYNISEVETSSDYVFKIISNNMTIIEGVNTWDVSFDGPGVFQVTEIDTGIKYNITSYSPDSVTVTENPTSIFNATYNGYVMFEVSNNESIGLYNITILEPTYLLLEKINGEYELTYNTPIIYNITQNGSPVDESSLPQSYQDLIEYMLSSNGLHNLFFSGLGSVLDPEGLTVTNQEDSYYVLSYRLNTSMPIFSNGGYFGMNIKTGTAGMTFDFQILTGDVYTVNGTVTDINGDPVEGVYVDLWGPEGGAHTETDENGFYQMRINAGIWEFGTWDETTQTGTYNPSLSVFQDITRNVVLVPQINIMPEGDNYLGTHIDGDTVIGTIYAESDGHPVLGLTQDVFDIWVHNWDEDTSNWWDNPVENQYHTNLAPSEFTVNEEGSGVYTVSFQVNASSTWHTYGLFSNGGLFDLDVRVGQSGMGFNFEVLSGDFYTVNGTVTDMQDNPVEGAEVDLWNSTSGGGHATTDADGYYSMVAKPGTWEFGVWDDNLMQGYYQAGLVIDRDRTLNVTIFPEIETYIDGDPFLGFVQDGDLLLGEVQFLYNGTSITGFDTSILTVWIHSNNDPTLQDQDPDNDWFKTRIPNEYHTKITSEATINELANGTYQVEYTVNTSKPVLAQGGMFSIEAEFSGRGVHWPFGILQGDILTINGTITDLDGYPVQGAHVNIWNNEYWFGSKTNESGAYEIKCVSGTYEFGIEPAPESGYNPYYIDTLVINQSIYNYDVVLSSSGETLYTVSGTVMDDQNNTIEGITLQLYDFSAVQTYNVTSDSLGYYEFSIPAADYEFTALVDTNIFEDPGTQYITVDSNILDYNVTLVVKPPPPPPS